jgi:hypothetical protein
VAIDRVSVARSRSADTLGGMSKERAAFAVSRRSLFAGAAAITVSGLLPRIARADAGSAPALAGSYRFAGGDAERRALQQAIDKAVDRVSVFVREVARDRLENANPVPSELTLGVDDSTLTLAYGAESFTAPLDGRTVRIKARGGEEMQLRLEPSKTFVDQVFSSEDGSRTNRLRPSGDKLVVEVVVRAPKLEKALVYRLTYARRR